MPGLKIRDVRLSIAGATPGTLPGRTGKVACAAVKSGTFVNIQRQGQPRRNQRRIRDQRRILYLRPPRRNPTARGIYMKWLYLVTTSLILLAAISALAAPHPSIAKVPAFPGILANARYVYVASYDGDQFNPNLLPEDREAIAAVQDSIQKWGKLIIVYRPSEADIIILVTSRPSEDLLAVYDGHQWPSGNFLWRVMGRDGLQAGETPLVTTFQKGFESVQKHK
jgi:hypothetical protein